MKNVPLNSVRSLFLLCAVVLTCPLSAHETDAEVSSQVRSWLGLLGEKSAKVTLDFDSAHRYQFRWTPGERQGIRLDALNKQQKEGLKTILNTVLSTLGAVKVDAIIATEAALAVIQQSPEFRNPGKYYTAVFGDPDKGHWGLRFEGHHLSVNLTFQGDTLVSATPLFLGVNPETISNGPDKGLRALNLEMDLARELFLSLSGEQRKIAQASKEWFAGFLTDAGTRRAKMGQPIGIQTADLNQAQQRLLKRLIGAYVETIKAQYASHYMGLVGRDWANIRFFWKGSAEKGEDFYYRIRGQHTLIELDTQSGDTHIHAIWRDAKSDFGGL